MGLTDYSRFFFAFAFVVGLMWALTYIMKRLGLDKKLRGVTGAQDRLSVVDVLYLDPKRKLTLVRADNREYLLFISGDNAQVVDRLGGAHEPLA